MFKKFFAGLFVCAMSFNVLAVDIYSTDAPLEDENPNRILPLIMKAKKILGTQGHWDSYRDPDYYHFVQKAIVEIDMINGSERYFKDLELFYIIYARHQSTKEIYSAGVGRHNFSIKKLENYVYRTNALFFEGSRTAYETLVNYKSGDKYYGYIISVWNEDELVGFYSNPRRLSKNRVKIRSIRHNILKDLPSKKSL